MINIKEGTQFSLKNRSLFQWIIFVFGCISLFAFLMSFVGYARNDFAGRLWSLGLGLLSIWSATAPRKKDIPKDAYDDVLDANLDED